MLGVKVNWKMIRWVCLLNSLMLLALGVGCAPKKVVQPLPPVAFDHEEINSPELPTQQSSPHRSLASKHSDYLKSATPISDLLMSQYQVWKKVPHRTGGLDHRGIDCSGLLLTIFQDVFDIDLPRTSREQSQLGYAVQPHQRRPGDLVFFKDRGLDHIGVVVNDHQFLHATTKRGVVLSQFDSYWKPRLRCVRRVLEN